MAINGPTSRSSRARFAGLGPAAARWRVPALILLARIARMIESTGSGLAWRRGGLVAVLALACLAPFFLSSYHLLQLTEVLVYAIALLGLNMLLGFNGQVSLGHGAFYAIGAYTTAILMNSADVPYWVTVPLAGILCLVVGFLFGRPALRLEGLYLGLATFALATALPQLLKFKGFEHWTGGVQGIVFDKPDAPLGLPIDGDQWLYFFCLAVTVPLFVLGWNLLRGRTGRALAAIREHPTAAATMGIDTALYKSATFGVSAMYTGIAGALGAIITQFVAPDSFPVFLSVTFFVGIIVGGIRSIAGAFPGALFIVLIPNFADQISKAAPGAIYGILLIGFVYLMPMGVAGLVWLLWGRLVRLAEEGERLAGEGKRT